MIRHLMIFAVICLSFGLASAQDILLEAEDFTASHNEGGNPILQVSCSGASGGLAVEGLDYPGDWIELSLAIWNGSFTDTMRSAGLLDSASVLGSTVFGADPLGNDLISVFPTYGLGIG